ncbi:MFS transporter [Halomonas campisalis]|uniref:MFS transporter n=1 Tax=Billgrantia campisalis TaxID=74661 RepID=A0ABS9P9K1_9GAMM|nr:MFS transporter [Halomonas campisalis]MCG6658459.1 MFS transporter [Halomonas campisalis]MDR5863319.1 MFS transporter [Halomonas campisalis]
MPADSSSQARQTSYRYFLAFIAIGMSGGLLGPALPHLADATNSSMGQIAVLFTARALGNMLGSVVSGALVDRLPGHRVLAAMLLLLAAGLAGVPLAHSLALLTALVFVLGFAEVSINAGANTLLLWNHGVRSPPWISALHFCFGLGNMLVPLLLVAVLALSGQATWTFWLVALWALLLIAPLWGRTSPRSAPARDETRPPPPPPDAWRLGLFLGLFALYVGMEVTFAGWITAYATLEGLAAGEAALLVTLFWLTLSAGRLLAIPLLRRLTPWMVLQLCLGLGLVSALGLTLDWLPLTAVALLFGLACSAIFPTLFGLSNQLMRMSGRTTGWIFLAAGSGAMAVPTLAGPLLEWAGTRTFPLLLLGLLALMVAGLVILRRRVSRGE